MNPTGPRGPLPPRPIPPGAPCFDYPAPPPPSPVVSLPDLCITFERSELGGPEGPARTSFTSRQLADSARGFPTVSGTGRPVRAPLAPFHSTNRFRTPTPSILYLTQLAPAANRNRPVRAAGPPAHTGKPLSRLRLPPASCSLRLSAPRLQYVRATIPHRPPPSPSVDTTPPCAGPPRNWNWGLQSAGNIAARNKQGVRTI